MERLASAHKYKRHLLMQKNSDLSECLGIFAQVAQKIALSY